VDGTGKQCKSGGQVVKNVTGYDLHKLLIGSLGTLGVITRLNFRTFPLPELHGAHLASFPTTEAALNFQVSLLKSGLPLSNLELFDSELSTLLADCLNKVGGGVPQSLATSGWHVFTSFEGSAPVLERITRETQKFVGHAQAARNETLDLRRTQLVNEALREAFDWLLRAAQGVALLRIVLPRVASDDVAEMMNLARQTPLRAAFVLRACNVAYLTLLADNEDSQSNAMLEHGVSELFSRVEAKKGNAALLHAPRWLKDRINVWGAERADFPLMQRVKQAFDPHSIFAPGRFVGGI
jgi:glycolate oxidase FAD binding subunit